VSSISIANITDDRFLDRIVKQVRQLTLLFCVEVVFVNIVDLEIALASQ
jgi:hypothetical protein